MSLLLVALAVYVVVAVAGALGCCAKAWQDLIRAPELTRKVTADASDDALFGSLFSAIWPLLAMAVIIELVKLLGKQLGGAVVWLLITRPRRRRYPHERIPTRDARGTPADLAARKAYLEARAAPHPVAGPSRRARAERITWEGDPARQAQNGGRGCCNTSGTRPGVCSLGGIGCNVDHDAIDALHGRPWTIMPSPMTRF